MSWHSNTSSGLPPPLASNTVRVTSPLDLDICQAGPESSCGPVDLHTTFLSSFKIHIEAMQTRVGLLCRLRKLLRTVLIILEFLQYPVEWNFAAKPTRMARKCSLTRSHPERWYPSSAAWTFEDMGIFHVNAVAAQEHQAISDFFGFKPQYVEYTLPYNDLRDSLFSQGICRLCRSREHNDVCKRDFII